MRKQILSALLAAAALLSGAHGQSQPSQGPAPAAKQAMAKLAWLVGEWEGKGWRIGPDGARTNFTVREKAAAKLDGLVITVEGKGWHKGPDGEKVMSHNAFGVYAYDAFAQRYHFDAVVQDGYISRGTPIVSEGRFEWSHAAGPGVEMRYVGILTDNGEWLETGAYCQGDDCRQTFEMRLKRVE